jgi:predicted O-methyltransferase YrrM
MASTSGGGPERAGSIPASRTIIDTRRLQKYCRGGNCGFNRFQYEGLINLIESIPNNGIMVEIGAFDGDATEFFALNFNKVFVVDSWESGRTVPWLTGMATFNAAEAHFDSRMEPYKNITKIKKLSTEAAKMFQDDFFDFIYIDADHEYKSVCDDIAAWLPKLKNDGVIAGHDFIPQFPGVKRAVQERFKKVSVFKDSSWSAKKCDLKTL